jgi:hypothetical protein
MSCGTSRGTAGNNSAAQPPRCPSLGITAQTSGGREIVTVGPLQLCSALSAGPHGFGYPDIVHPLFHDNEIAIFGIGMETREGLLHGFVIFRSLKARSMRSLDSLLAGLEQNCASGGFAVPSKSLLAGKGAVVEPDISSLADLDEEVFRRYTLLESSRSAPTTSRVKGQMAPSRSTVITLRWTCAKEAHVKFGW